MRVTNANNDDFDAKGVIVNVLFVKGSKTKVGPKQNTLCNLTLH